METIYIKVLSKVLCQFEETDANKKIAIEASSASLKKKIKFANKNNIIPLRIANVINLNLGDTEAIWRAHNQDHMKDFDALFRFLCHHPGLDFEFVCSIN